MKRNKSLGVFSSEQDANNIALERAMGMKQGDVMDWQTADRNNSNPGYKRKNATAEGYIDNCQTCTMTYEARRRGFKTTAAPRPGEKYVDPNNFYTFTKKNGMTWRERFLNTDGTAPKPTSSAGASIEDTIVAKAKFISDNTTAEGRYEVYCAWKSGGAHVFIVERDKNGALIWIDPQTGKTGDPVRLYKDSMKPESIEVLRIDDKIINPKFASRMIKKTK